MRKKPQSIGQILNSRPEKSPLMQQVKAAMVLERVKEFLIQEFGNGILSKVKPVYVRDRVLTISCLSSVISQEIKYREKRILSLVNKEFGNRTIERIRFT